MRFMKLLSCALLMLLPLGVLASSVSSMTSEILVQGPDGSNYIESGVNCRGTNEARTIWRKESESEWCAKGVEGICSRQKIRVAQRVCGRQYANQLEEARLQDGEAQDVAEDIQPAGQALSAAVITEVFPGTEEAPAATSPAPDVQPAAMEQGSRDTGAQQRQLEIERERLKIEQERLELRRQQVELQKQELELQRQLGEKPQESATPAAPAPRQPAASDGASGGTPHRSVLGM
jgi:hypothetical protein